MIKISDNYRIWVTFDSHEEFDVFHKLVDKYERLKATDTKVVLEGHDWEFDLYYELEINDAGREIVEHWIEELNNYIQK